jgi:hypothetical protein
MPENSQPDHVRTFIIRGETLRGTTHDILLELDREILGLLALRQKIASEGPMPDHDGRRTSRACDLWHRIVTAS